jgi:sarcosine oxidase
MPVFLRFGAPCFYGLPALDVPGVKVCMHHGGEVTRAEGLDRALRGADEAEVRRFVEAHLPVADGPLLGARVCMYTNTPDGHFVVGGHPHEPSRITLACGFSGHGFKLAPTIGEMVAARILDGVPTPALFDPARFAAGAVAP